MSRIAVALAFIVFLGSTLCLVLGTHARAADCSWRVGGKLQVNTGTRTSPLVRPLEGVTVQVAATLYSWGGFTTWDTVETDATGRFEIVNAKSCAKRRFRVWMKLDNADFQVKNGAGDEWLLLREDSSSSWVAWTADSDLGSYTWGDGQPGHLGEKFALRRALSWSVLTRMSDWLEARDPWLGFGRKIHVKYPSDTPAGVSFAAIDTAYIHSDASSDQWSYDTLLHEVMHLWNYDHNSGVTNWLAGVLWDFDTHGTQEHPSIAFHEGFAEFAAQELYQELFGGGSPSWDAYDDFASLAAIEGNDWAVASVLWLMEGTYVPLADMLLCFRGNPTLGWPKDLELGGTAQGLLMYLDRCDDLLASFTPTEHAALLAAISP